MLKIIILIVLLGAATIAGAVWGRPVIERINSARATTTTATTGAKLDAKDDAEKALWTTAEVKRGEIVQSVAATGRVVANLDVDIKCKASGTVITLPIDISDEVKKNDLLVKLDPIDEQRDVDQAKVAVVSAQAKLESAKQNLTVAEMTLVTDRQHAEATINSMDAASRYIRIKADRLKAVWEAGNGTKEEYDAADAAAVEAAMDLVNAKVKLDEIKTQTQALELKRQDVNLAQAAFDSAQITLAISNQRLSDTTILAPIDGVIAARNVAIGTIISSGISNVGGGTTVLTISDLSRVFVYASVDESDIGQVQVGQAANVTADGFPGRKFSGKVVRIATRGVNVTNVITFETRIEVTSPNKKLLKPEMTANIEIVAAKNDDALLLPAEALTRKSGKRIVTALKPDGSTEERTVEAGITDGTNVEIKSGLNEGESVTYKKGAGDSRWKGDPSKNNRSPGGIMFGGTPRR